MSFKKLATTVAAAVAMLWPINAKTAEPLMFLTTEIPGYVTKDGGAYRSMIETAAQSTGVDVSFRLMKWVRAVERVEKSDRQLIIPFSRTAEREDRFQWATPLNDVRVGFVTLDDSVDSLEEAKSLNHVIVWKGSSNADYLIEQGLTNLFPVSDSETIMQMLLSGRGSAWFGVLDEAHSFLSQDGGAPLVLGEPIFADRVWIAGGAAFNPSPYRDFFAEVDRLREAGFVSDHLATHGVAQ